MILTKRKARITKVKKETIETPANPDIRIRCIHDGLLIVGSNTTVTGRAYKFESGQIRPVDYRDYPILLALETKPAGCCGGTVEPQKYFEEVK